MTMVRALLAVAVFLFPLATHAAAMTFEELALDLVEILDMATFTLFIFGIVAYFWGISTNILNFGSEKDNEKKKSFFVWGLIILFVLFTVWGIIQLIRDTFLEPQFQPSSDAPLGRVVCYADGTCINPE